MSIKVPSVFDVRKSFGSRRKPSNVRHERRRVVLVEVPKCADCKANMSSTPGGLVCYECGGTNVL